MRALIIENKIVLVADNELIKVTLMVPERNIQNMIDLTGCRVFSKIAVEANFNHHAGQLFNVTIAVHFNMIEKYFGMGSMKMCSNAKEYFSLFYSPHTTMYVSYNEAQTAKTGLYAFGGCSTYVDYRYKFNVLYSDIEGKKRNINRCKQNDYGKKRYIRFKGRWLSNQAF